MIEMRNPLQMPASMPVNPGVVGDPRANPPAIQRPIQMYPQGTFGRDLPRL